MFMQLYRAQWPGLPVSCPIRHLIALSEPKIDFNDVQKEDVLHDFVFNSN